MASFLRISIKGVEKVLKNLEKERERQMLAMEKAHTKVATEAVKELKQGLSNNGGRGKDRVSSPKGDLPFLHTGQLRASIGFKVLRRGNKIASEVGSGASVRPAPYAKYLEGYNHDGIRPFLKAIKNTYTPSKIIKQFYTYYKGGK